MFSIANVPVMMAIAVATGPVLFFRGFGRLRTQQLIQNTPTARIRSMAMGLVEIYGSVSPRSTVTGPFSGRPCAYWEVDIATRARNSFTVIHRKSSGHPFFLTDETGTALVYPSGAELKINFGTSEECFGLNLPECYAEYLKENGGIGTTLARGGTLRFRERLLEQGQAVFVLGTATPRAQSQVISEMEATGTDDIRPNRVVSLDSHVSAVIRKGQNEPTFLISQQSEAQVEFGFGIQAMGMLVGGPLLTLVGLGYWLMKLSSK